MKLFWLPVGPSAVSERFSKDRPAFDKLCDIDRNGGSFYEGRRSRTTLKLARRLPGPAGD